MKTVREMSRQAGVSVRTLHHYDAIGLLKPTAVTEAGYRLYDEEAAARLETILLFREAGFSLSHIGQMLDHPEFDRQAAISRHIEALRRERDRLDRVIAEAERMKEGKSADFAAFDRSDMEAYAEEVKARWGQTDAYRACEAKMKTKSDAEKQSAADGLLREFGKLGTIRHLPPESAEAREAVAALQAYITGHFYPCTREILAGLGQMYAADERFTAAIDQAGGEGTAAFVSRAIAAFCR